MRICYLLFCILFISLPLRAETIHLLSDAFTDSDALPVLYSCDGEGIVPSLNWSNTPKETKSFVITLQDDETSSGIMYHWVIFNIPANKTQIEENKPLPNGTLIGKNSWDKATYFPPCPPKGTLHAYTFTIYAVDTQLTLPLGTHVKEILGAIKNHIIQQDTLPMTYNRWQD